MSTHERQHSHRIDDCVVFHVLTKENIKLIAELQLDGLMNRLHGLGYLIKVDDNAIDFLVDKGFDPVYGARPLKRICQQYLENPLAKKILQGQLKRVEVIQVVSQDGMLRFEQN